MYIHTYILAFVVFLGVEITLPKRRSRRLLKRSSVDEGKYCDIHVQYVCILKY